MADDIPQYEFSAAPLARLRRGSHMSRTQKRAKRGIMTFKSGDVVLVKSGSPRMTVTLVDPISGMVHCTWLDGNKHHTAEFHPDVLVPAPNLSDVYRELAEASARTPRSRIRRIPY